MFLFVGDVVLNELDLKESALVSMLLMSYDYSSLQHEEMLFKYSTTSLYMSRVTKKHCLPMRKAENKGADQLRSNCEADQHACFRYSDSTISLLPKSKISSF